MRKHPEHRRAALAWYPRTLSGVRPYWRKTRAVVDDAPDPEDAAICEALAELRGEGKVEFAAVVHGHPVTVRVSVMHDTDSDPRELTEIEWVHGKNNERERIGYLRRGIARTGRQGVVQRQPIVNAKIIRARRGHFPDRCAYEACDVSGYMENWLRDARKAGMSRHAAWEWAKACALTEYESLERFNDNDWCYVGITVEVISEIGSYEAEVAGGLDLGVAYDPYEKGSDEHLRGTARDCVHTALAAARRDTQSGFLPGIIPSVA